MQKNKLITVKEYCGVDLLRNRFLNEEKILQVADSENGGSVIRTVYREKITCIDSYDDIINQLHSKLFLKGFVDVDLSQRIAIPYKYIRFFLHPDRTTYDNANQLWQIYTTFAKSHPMYAQAESVEQLPVDFNRFDRYLENNLIEPCYINVFALKKENFEVVDINNFNFTKIIYGSLIITILQSLSDIKNLKEIAHHHASQKYPFIELIVKRWVDRKGEEHSSRFIMWTNPHQIANAQNGGWGTEITLTSGELYFVENSLEEILAMIQQKILLHNSYSQNHS